MSSFHSRLLALATRPWLLSFSLALLHLGLAQDVTTRIGRGLMIGHLGAVMLWQPIVRQDRQIAARELLVGSLLLCALGIYMSWGMALLWMLVLSGLLGAELFRQASGRVRLSYWIAEAYLILMLIGLVLPRLLPADAQPDDVLGKMVGWGAPILIASIPLLAERAAKTRQQMALDFIGGMVIVLVVSGVLLGALALMFVSDARYMVALLQALGLMAVCLVALGWAWSSEQGAGLSLAVARHALSGGAPFTQWLDEVARSAASDETPETLVGDAVHRMMAWPGIDGADWRINEGPAERVGFVGRVSKRRCRLSHGSLEIGLHTRHELTAMHLWQMDLMVRLLAEFHAAKEQARYLQSMSYLRAVHETGARVTHEIKNLLQSLDTLCFAVSGTGRTGREEGFDAGLDALLQRQLPMISQRLHAALERIRQPLAADVQEGPAADWWASLEGRYGEEQISFSLDDDGAGASLPVLLFDTVADNLLRNALDKEGDPAVRVSLKIAAGTCSLTVEDLGEVIDADRATQLFLRPLPSDGGLGIGLYQAGRLAESLDYRLQLISNRSGAVAFELARVRPLAS